MARVLAAIDLEAEAASLLSLRAAELCGCRAAAGGSASQ